MMNAAELKLLEAIASAVEGCVTVITISLTILQGMDIPIDAKMAGAKLIGELQARTVALGDALTAFKAHRQAVERMSGGAPS